MVAMEVAMNSTDFILVGGAELNWKVLPMYCLLVFSLRFLTTIINLNFTVNHVIKEGIMIPVNPDRKTVLITGGNKGIGFAIAKNSQLKDLI